MSTFLRVDINLAAMIILGVVIFIAFRRLDGNDTLSRVFLMASLAIMLELFFETATCIINRRPEKWLIQVSVVLHVCLFTTAPVLTYLWYNLIKKLVAPKEVLLSKANTILLIPLVVNFFITLLSPAFSLVFYIDSLNVYHRGVLFPITTAITYFYLLFSFVLILRNKRKIVKQEYVPLFFFGIMPAMGGLIQGLLYGTLLMWSSTAFSLVIVFIFLQQRMVHLDSLTGAWTRGSFDYYISQRIGQKLHGKFGIIYTDIDGLKEINDKYGHVEGDYVIKTAIEIIRRVLRKNDIIARVGGDEFVIIINCDSIDILEKTIERMNSSFIHYNNASDKSYRLECSFGADMFDSEYNSIEQFIHHVDNLMYSNKKLKKELQSK